MPTQFKLAPTDNKQKVLESGKPKKETEEKK